MEHEEEYQRYVFGRNRQQRTLEQIRVVDFYESGLVYAKKQLR